MVAGASMSKGHLTVEGRDVKISEPANRTITVSYLLSKVIQGHSYYACHLDVINENIIYFIKVVEKQRATFEFEVNEDEVEGRWLKNGVEIQFTVEKRFNYVTIKKMHRLTISETYRSDAGEYTFIAGKNRSTMNLLVKSKN